MCATVVAYFALSLSFSKISLAPCVSSALPLPPYSIYPIHQMEHEQVHHKIITYIISWHTFNATSDQISLFFFFARHEDGMGWFCVGDILCCKIIIIIISVEFRDPISCAHVVLVVDRWWYDEIGMSCEYAIDFIIFIFHMHGHSLTFNVCVRFYRTAQHISPRRVKCIEQITVSVSKWKMRPPKLPRNASSKRARK